ncbi:MAG: protoporphyrinogen oxidase [Chloroflexota bacterium]
MSSASNKPDAEGIHVSIVGGGIAGLSAAWFLQEAQKQYERPIQYTLLEQSNRWGGKIKTESVPFLDGEDFIVEGGPDSFITQKPWALQLARSLGLDDRLLPTNDDRRQTYVLNDGKPTPLPDGVLLIVPTKFLPFALSPLISLPGKLRMGLDLFIPPCTDNGDETLADFITRRLGDEALDKIAEPLLSGIYNAEAEKQSLLATFPRFRDIERRHGSLIKGMLASRRASNARKAESTPPKQRTSIFMSLKGGMEELVKELTASLEGDLRLNTAVESITGIGEKDGESAAGGRYALELNNGQRLHSDAVILAVPAYVAARLVRPLSPKAARRLDRIRYVSTGTISLAYDAREFSHPLDGFGVVIPRTEQRSINAITWTSTKFDRRAPQGAVLIRAFFGGSRTPHMMDVDDEELLTVVRSEIASIMGVRATPLFHKIFRYPDANPQYDVGHLERVAEIENALPPRLFVTGSPYRGIGIPDCVHQAQNTVETLLAQPAVETP